MAKLAIGLDIGGTKIRGVLFDGRKILRREEWEYPKKQPGKKEFSAGFLRVADALLAGMPRQKIVGIGVGTAGMVAGEKVFAGRNLKAVEKLNLPRLLYGRYRLPVRMQNDAKAAAWGEYRLGAGRKNQFMFMITLGTGLGGAHIKNGTLQTGAFDSAYEMGFIIIDAERARTGARGDFEWFGAEQFFKSRGLDPIEAELGARRGNKKLLALWREYGEYLGIGIASIVNLLEPEIFVVGGGISHAWPLFAPSMRKTARRLISSPLARQKMKIVRAKLGRDAGAIGAALLIHSRR